MNESEFRPVIQKFGFNYAADIHLENDNPTFVHKNQTNDCGIVYLWVEVTEREYTIVYVGKTERQFKNRCDDYKNPKSKVGKRHAENFRNGIKHNKKYLAFMRKSEAREILGEPKYIDGLRRRACFHPEI